MKKLLTLAALASTVCALGFAACGDGDGGDGYDGNLLFEEIGGNGKVTAYSVCGIKDGTETEIVIPSEYKGLPVTAVSGGAFKGCTQIESVTVGENVTDVGAGAFAQCSNIKSVKAHSIESWCSVKFADAGANPMYFATEFYAGGAPAGDLKIPDSVTKVPDFAFYMCDNLTGVTVGSGVTYIGSNAFYGCNNLETVKIGGKVETMGELAFADCPSLKTLEIGKEVQTIGEYAFLNCASVESVTVPSSVKRIEEAAFMSCKGITELNLNDGLLYIGDSAFADCTSLAEFNMPSSVDEIGFGVIMFGSSGGFDPVTGMDNRVSEITLSDKLTEIPDFAFSFCAIKTIEFGDKVTKINYSALYGCDQLESVVLPASLKNITSYAFYRCSALNTVFYKGTPQGWEAVKIGKSGNDNFTGANGAVPAEIYFYSESKPSDGGNYWHYVGETPTKW